MGVLVRCHSEQADQGEWWGLAGGYPLVSRDPFTGFLDRLALWDIGAPYAWYSVFFDLVICTAIFTALTQAVYYRRFPGRSGQGLSGAFETGLGVTLALAEDQFGRNLRQARTIATFIVLLGAF